MAGNHGPQGIMSSDADCAYPGRLSPQAVREGLKTRWLGQQAIYCFDAVESTNTEASNLARQGAVEGTVVLAEAQRKGRGRLGRSWISHPGTGVCLSVILRPQTPPEWGGRLTLTAGVAVAAAIAETGIRPELKWPNDIMISDHKVGGILTEASFGGNSIGPVIVGVGINVDTNSEDFPVSIRNIATSLRLSSGIEVSRVALVQAFLRQLEQWYELFCKGSFGAILETWREYETVLGGLVEVYLPDSRLQGMAENIDSDGALLVRDKKGRLHRIMGGDVVRCRVRERQRL
ncbi:MAG: biotin--[acetyl-CoA-carboxylase] ligase [Desulfobacterales bacterium]|nr:biotin--[acetyl-CoA-carboxylase] ligase [Desulfobacterales bacterium]